MSTKKSIRDDSTTLYIGCDQFINRETITPLFIDSAQYYDVHVHVWEKASIADFKLLKLPPLNLETNGLDEFNWKGYEIESVSKIIDETNITL